MQVVLRQTFPLGRFHATPWRVNSFDDPHGEWPPSPWRLIRALVARWYQWRREVDGAVADGTLERIIEAFCQSRVSFFLPSEARRGTALRQYQPVDFSWKPKENKKGTIPQEKVYGTTLVQDNYWAVPPRCPVWWLLEGGGWADDLLGVLDQCLERIAYFGRAESLTELCRWTGPLPEGVAANCQLQPERRSRRDVPVLVPVPDATPEQVQCITDQAHVRGSTVPPGAAWHFARRPDPIPLRPPVRQRIDRSEPRRLVQLALGWNVAPELRAVVRLTDRFRGRVLRELLRIKTGDRNATWNRVDVSVREALADMVGKDAQGVPLVGHRHTEFLPWIEDGVPARLLVWRDGRPFDEDEHTAILKAASRDLSWAAAGSDADAWKVRLVALDRAVPPPPGFDGSSALSWETVTPYVPPRHHLRGGKPRERESLGAQIRRELASRGFSDAERVEVEQIGGGAWVAVHVPRSKAAKRPFLGDRRGYFMRLTFPTPVRGPLRLGHSSSFGLGLFRPVVGGGHER